MAIENGYTDLVTVKARLDVGDTDDDAALEGLVETASRALDDALNRRFYIPAIAEVRVYSPIGWDLVKVNDLVDISSNLTSVKVDTTGDGNFETILTTSDYDPEPRNADMDLKPFTKLRIAKDSSRHFPTGRMTVELTAKFGWAISGNPPKQITEACLMICARLWKRRDAVFGVAGTTQMGTLQVLTAKIVKDPDIWFLISRFYKGDLLAV